MCTSPPCPHGCRTVSGTGRQKRQNLYRAYVRARCSGRRPHAVPVGWWCPGCHAFVDDLR